MAPRLAPPTGLDPKNCSFSHDIRARFAETDAMGIVHHASYLLYLEEARFEWLRQLGRDYATLRDAGHDFAVLEVFAQYVTPIRFDEVLTVHLRMGAVTRSRFQVDYLLTVGGDRRALASTVHACVTTTGRPVRLPDWLAELSQDGPIP